MSHKLSETTQARINKWAEDLGLEVSELEEQFQVKYAMLAEILKDQDVPASTIESKARSQLGNEIRPGRSRALTYEGIVLGFTQISDWNEFPSNLAKGAYDKDGIAAVDAGVVDATGNPIWTEETMEKKGQYFKGKVGDLILPEYERHVLAIGRPVKKVDESDSAIRLFWIKLSGEPTQFNANNPAPKPGQVCRWRCNIQEVIADLNLIRANGATITQFEPAQFLAGEGTDREKILEGVLEPKMCRTLLEQVHTSFSKWDTGEIDEDKDPVLRGLDVEDIPEWLEAHSNTKGYLTASHFAVIETEIMGMYKTGMRIGNADRQDITDVPNMFVNIDSNIINEMYYGEGSTVLVAIEPFMRKKKDADRKDIMDENNKPVKEAVGECLAVFPVFAMPVKAPVVAKPVAETTEAVAETKAKPASPTIEL